MFLPGLLHLLQHIMVHLAHLAHLVHLDLHRLLQPHTQRHSRPVLPCGRVLHHLLVHLGQQFQGRLQERQRQRDLLEQHQDRHPLHQPQLLHQVQQQLGLLLLSSPPGNT